MTQRRQGAEVTLPTLTKSEALARLKLHVERGRALRASPVATESQAKVWLQSGLNLIGEAYGSASSYRLQYAHATNKEPSRTDYGDYRGKLSVELVGWVAGGCEFLEALIGELEAELGATGQLTPADGATSFWDDVHTSIVASSKSQFEEGFFADAVDAAFKEVNFKIKRHVRAKIGKELDGAGLMTTAFSPSQPIVTLADQSTESGRNIQQGFMQIFAGAMTGIRNPGAHENLEINGVRARHLIYLASLLAFTFDERVQ